MLARVRREADARVSADEALRVSLADVESRLTNEISKLKKSVVSSVNGRTVNASAIAGLVQRVQVEPGFALAEQVTTLEARVDDNMASYDESIRVLVDSVHAEATKTETLTSRFAGNEAKIVNIESTYATKTFAESKKTEAITASAADATAKVLTESTARATADTAISSTVTTLTATVSGNTAAITAEATARANADSAISTTVSTLTATVSGNTAAISAESSARAAADGRVSGQFAMSVDAGGKVVGMTLTAAAGLSGGAGYVTAPTVSFVTRSGETGSGAAATATVVAGVVTSIEVTAPGSNYSSAPDVVLTGGGGAGAKATATIFGGAVTRVLTTPTSEVAFKAEAFKIFDGSSSTVAPFTVSGGVVSLSNAVVTGTLDIGSSYSRSRVDTSGYVLGYGQSQRTEIKYAGTASGVRSYGTNNLVVGLTASTSAGVDVGALALSTYVSGVLTTSATYGPAFITNTGGTFTLPSSTIPNLTVTGALSFPSGSLSVGGTLTSGGALTVSAGGAVVYGPSTFVNNLTTFGSFESVGTIFCGGAGANRVGFIDEIMADGFFGMTCVGLHYDAGNGRAVVGARTQGTGQRDVLIAPGAHACFGTYTAVGGLSVIGHLNVKDASGNIRKLAVVS